MLCYSIIEIRREGSETEKKRKGALELGFVGAPTNHHRHIVSQGKKLHIKALRSGKPK